MEPIKRLETFIKRNLLSNFYVPASGVFDRLNVLDAFPDEYFIRAVKIISFLELVQNLAFSKGLNI